MIAPAALGILPVACFVVALVVLDGWKLVRPRSVVLTLLLGAAAAGVCWFVAGVAIGGFAIPPRLWSRAFAPFLEEGAKGAIVAWLLLRHRVGFLVDAAIHGFAVGAGFAVVENAHYWAAAPAASVSVWAVRGFGTAIMHGGVTATFAIVAKTILDRSPSRIALALFPGWLAAAALHAAFNQFFVSPVTSALAILVVVPLLLRAAFLRGESAIADWLDVGLDTDAKLLEAIETGRLSESPVGSYLREIRERFLPETVVDLVCCLRLHAELSLKARGIVMLREAGFPAKADDDTLARVRELDFLERSIGPTGRLALAPLLHGGGGSARRGWERALLRE